MTVHRSRLAPADLDEDRPLTSPLRTMLDCGRTLQLGQSVVILESACLARLVDLCSVRAAASEARGAGAVALRQAVAWVDERSESSLESGLRMLVTLLGRATTQAWVPGVGHVDIVFDGWLALEGDGFEFHSDRRAYREDRRRGNALVVGRYVLLRFTWEDVFLRPHYVLQVVTETLAAGPPWR